MTILSRLAEKFGSDKCGAHSYTQHYETKFESFRDRDINLLEIGVGGYEGSSQGGASLKMWSAYFPLGKIWALDIEDKSAISIERVTIIRGSQDDAQVLQKLNTDAGGFDIVIDDGSHQCHHIIKSFVVLFPLLKDGGIYVIEDVQTSYWPPFGGSSDNPDFLTTTVGYFKSLIHGLNYNEINKDWTELQYFNENIVSIQFFHNIIMIHKGNNTEPSNFSNTDPARG